MALERYAFIVKDSGYEPLPQSAVLSSRSFSTTIVAVSSFEHAQQEACRLVANGTQLIELCGGFSQTEAEALRTTIADAVPVGVVTYSAEQDQIIGKLFSAKK